MPSLSGKFSHLEALREQAPRVSRLGEDCEDGIMGSYNDEFNSLSIEGLGEDEHDYLVALANASPWLIPLAQQAEKLADALGRPNGLHTTICRQDSDPQCNACKAEKALAAYQAIVKEAENA